MKTLKRQAGFGLLELMLSMVIVALLLIMATRYYQSARQNARINQAVGVISAIDNAANNIAIGDGNFANIKAMTDLQNYLPNNSIIDPWGGTMVMSSPSDTSFVVTMPGITNSDACTKLMQALSSTSGKSGYYDTYKCDTGGFALTVSMQGSSST